MESKNEVACQCWANDAYLHEGHCCFGGSSPSGCHDVEGQDVLRRRNSFAFDAGHLKDFPREAL